MISQSDFSTWQADSVTKAVFASIQDRITQAVETLKGWPINDPHQINWTRGYIKAYEEILGITFEDTENGD